VGAATAIPAQYHVQASSAIPDTTAAHSNAPVFDPETRQWKATVFPTQLPSTREEVLHLARVLDILLKEVDAGRVSPKLQQAAEDAGEDAGGVFRPVLLQSTRGLLPLLVVLPELQKELRHAVTTFASDIIVDLPAWEVVLFEIVRQCFVGCEDRGALLERVRCRYLQLREEIVTLAKTAQDVIDKAHAAYVKVCNEKHEVQDECRALQAKLDDIYERGPCFVNCPRL
jgi:hypothetical protein